MKELNYTSNDMKLLTLISLPEMVETLSFCIGFQIIYERSVFELFSTKKTLSGRDTRLLQTLGKFGIFSITLTQEI